MSAVAYETSSHSAVQAVPVGRSFVLGLPDKSGNYCIGIANAVWTIPSGSYAPGDRVRVMSALDSQLQVECVKN
jgi:hypothetical protein